MATEGDILARARFVLAAPQKVRLVIDMVRGKPATEALELLRFTPKAAAGPVGKVLRSAIANAEQNFGMNQDDLVVDQIWADEGPSRRWRRFGARGRAKTITRRAAHTTL